MNWKSRLGISLCLIMSIILGSNAAVWAAEANLERVKQVLRYFYVDILSEEQLNQYNNAESLVRSLQDPYTELMDFGFVEEFIDSINGETVALGFFLEQQENGNLLILQVLEDSSAQQAGLQENDLIIQVNDQVLAELTDQELENILQPVLGESVKLVVLRDGQQLEFLVSYGFISFPIVESTLLDQDILYIALYSFGEYVPELVAKEVGKYKNVQGIILDLRGNLGGYDEEAFLLADDFLGEGAFYWVQRRDVPPEGNFFDNQDMRYTQPLVVLVDSETASAAEMFTAAIQDFQRGIVVGEQTYGKFCGQTLYPVGNDYYLKYTIAYVLSPDKHNYQNIGLSPDILEKEDSLSTAIDLINTSMAEKDDFQHCLWIDLKTQAAILDVQQQFSTKNMLLNGADLKEEDSAGGQVYLDVQILKEILDKKFQWNAQTLRGSLREKNRVISFGVEDPELKKQGNHYYLSLSKVADTLGGKLVLDPDTQTAHLYWN